MLSIEDDEIDTDIGVIVDDGDYRPQINKAPYKAALSLH